MGVPGFFGWLIRNKKKMVDNIILKEIEDNNIEYLMLDTNCLLHPCVNEIISKYKKGELNITKDETTRVQIEREIIKLIKNKINDMIERIRPKTIYIAIDGVAPVGKILQQRQRRYRYLYDNKIRVNKNSNKIKIDEYPISSIELTPGTDYMERIHEELEGYIEEIEIKYGIRSIYSSYHEEGEGEHKILTYIKNKIKREEKVIIYGLDADLLFLGLCMGREREIYVMRESSEFDVKNREDSYNYVELSRLNNVIEGLNVSVDDFVVLCFMIGNDFMPHIMTLDIKRGGLDKIIESYIKLKVIKNIRNRENLIVIREVDNVRIDYNNLIKILEMLRYTEKNIWNNMNNMNSKYEEEEEKKRKNMKDLGENIGNARLDGIERKKFNNREEYYGYYIGIEGLEIEEEVRKMCREYIRTVDWCLKYYMRECIDWNIGYGYMIPPLIEDIIKVMRDKEEIRNIEEENKIKRERKLRPVEQLILAIPRETYEYVIDKEIIERMEEMEEIGYMFPKEYEIEVNRDGVYYKCPVRIPMIEIVEYIESIRRIKMEGKKNDIYVR
jgi:5'-3' exonuclease